MASVEQPGGYSSLTELVALNDEMAALVRTGTPFEHGLLDFGSDMPGRSGSMARQISARLAAGESLSHVLADPNLHLPPVWKAMVLAGVRSGRLASVLESLAAAGRRIAETRRVVASAMVYPIVVLVMAYLVFLFLVLWLAPLMARAYVGLVNHVPSFVSGLVWLSERAGWLALPPLLLAVALVLEWTAVRRGYASSEGPLMKLLSRLWPGIGRSRRDARLAAFTEILSLLVQHETPVGEALRLAGGSTGDVAIARAANLLADRYENGGSPAASEIRSLHFPPLLAFMLATGRYRPELGAALESTSRHYRQRSSAEAIRAAQTLPILCSTVIGGLVTAGIALTTLWPVWHLIHRLGSPT